MRMTCRRWITLTVAGRLGGPAALRTGTELRISWSHVKKRPLPALHSIRYLSSCLGCSKWPCPSPVPAGRESEPGIAAFSTAA